MREFYFSRNSVIIMKILIIKKMKTILKNNEKYVLSFQIGEDLQEELIKFCAGEDIKSAFFVGLGGLQELELSYYNLSEKRYEDKNIKENLEIVSLTGNVARLNNDIIIHMHGVFSDSKSNTIGGHVKKIVVSGTCEVFLTIFDDIIERKYDDATGLNLMK